MNETKIRDDIAPLGLDKGNEVWICGANMGLPYFPVHLSETDALEFLGRFAHLILVVETEPMKFPWERVIWACQREGMAVKVLDGRGNEVCR